ncbi:uncharacterized protein LJ206_013540 [Theristicus caerulescens]
MMIPPQDGVGTSFGAVSVIPTGDPHLVSTARRHVSKAQTVVSAQNVKVLGLVLLPAVGDHQGVKVFQACEGQRAVEVRISLQGGSWGSINAVQLTTELPPFLSHWPAAPHSAGVHFA